MDAADCTPLSAVGSSVHLQAMSSALHTAGGVSGIVRNSEEMSVGQAAPFIIAGTVRLADLNEQLNLNLESDYSDTIGGYIMEKAGEIPPAGYSLRIEPYLFTVVHVSANRITEVAVQELTEA